jgi:hypothetical protein
MAKFEGKGAPTLKFEGQVGDIYTDTDTGIKYECVQSYTSTDTIISKGDREYEWKKIEVSADSGGAFVVNFTYSQGVISADVPFFVIYDMLNYGAMVYGTMVDGVQRQIFQVESVSDSQIKFRHINVGSILPASIVVLTIFLNSDDTVVGNRYKVAMEEFTAVS